MTHSFMAMSPSDLVTAKTPFIYKAKRGNTVYPIIHNKPTGLDDPLDLYLIRAFMIIGQADCSSIPAQDSPGISRVCSV
jgi:hypothetical protein